METLIELLDMEPINYSQEGKEIRFWNIDGDITVIDKGEAYDYKTKDGKLVSNVGEVEVVAILGKTFNIVGLYEDYKLLLERNGIL